MPIASLKQDDIKHGSYLSDNAQLKMKRRYHVDLSSHITCCEMSYARLVKLLTGLEEKEHWRFKLNLTGDDAIIVTIGIIDRSKYTTTIRIVQHSTVAVYNLRLSVRLYHDASMAEVLSWSGHRRLAARYDYPNEKMYLADEKAQCNQFLSEWLDNSLKYGMSDLIFMPTDLL